MPVRRIELATAAVTAVTAAACGGDLLVLDAPDADAAKSVLARLGPSSQDVELERVGADGYFQALWDERFTDLVWIEYDQDVPKGDTRLTDDSWVPSCAWRFPKRRWAATLGAEAPAFVAVGDDDPRVVRALDRLAGGEAKCGCARWRVSRYPLRSASGDLATRALAWVDGAPLGLIHQGGLVRLGERSFENVSGYDGYPSAVAVTGPSTAWVARAGAVDEVRIEGARAEILETHAYPSATPWALIWLAVESGSAESGSARTFFTLTATGTLSYFDGAGFRRLAQLPLGESDANQLDPVKRVARGGGLLSVDPGRVIAAINSEVVYRVSVEGESERLDIALDFAADSRVSALAETPLGVVAGDGAGALHILRDSRFVAVEGTQGGQSAPTGAILPFRDGALATGEPAWVRHLRPYGPACATTGVDTHGTDDGRDAATDGVRSLVVTDFNASGAPEVVWLSAEDE